LSSIKSGDKGAELLSKASWPNLTTLHLFDNKIGEKGTDLSKASWPNLHSVSIYLAIKCGRERAEFLSKASWSPTSSILSFVQNFKLGEKGNQSSWSRRAGPTFTTLDLSSNQIGR